MKKLVEDEELEILNTFWGGMGGSTWTNGERSFALDYILVNSNGKEKVEDAWIRETEGVFESDHKMIGVNLKWSLVKFRKEEGVRERFLPEEKWSEYGKALDKKLGTNREKIQDVMVEVVRDFVVERPRARGEDWWDSKIDELVSERKKWCRKHRNLKKSHGTEEVEMEEACK